MITKRRPLCRGGVALLITLAAVVLTTAMCAVLVVAVTAARSSAVAGEAASIADDLLGAAESPIRSWLNEQSSLVVLPTSAAVPEVPVFHDAWRVGESNRWACLVRVTAWDQFGMVPIQLAHPGSPLRRALAREVLDILDRSQPAMRHSPGLDLLVRTRRDHERLRVFPAPSTNASDTAGAIGALVATHNPGGGWTSGTGVASGRINVNTAPVRLIAAALAAAGRGGIETIVAARAQGRRAPLPPALEHLAAPAVGPQLCTTSDAWAMRIDIRVTRADPAGQSSDDVGVTRSWWAVYTRSSSRWECVQRLAISE